MQGERHGIFQQINERCNGVTGVGTAGLTTGIIGTALGALNSGILGGNGLFGGWGNNNEVAAAALGALAGGMSRGCCSEDHTVNRYELGLQQQIGAKDAQIALRDANTYGDQKMLEMYKYIDGQLKEIRDTLCAQAVHNQRTEDSFVLARQDVAAVKSDLSCQIDTPLSKDRGFSLDDTNVSSIDELTPCVPRFSVLSLTDIS